MNLEFDASKSLINRGKHGIGFPDARALWEDEDRIEIPARTEDEPRHMVIGKIGTHVWSAVVVHRGDRVRIISVRSSNWKEKALYEGEGI